MLAGIKYGSRIPNCHCKSNGGFDHHMYMHGIMEDLNLVDRQTATDSNTMYVHVQCISHPLPLSYTQIYRDEFV